MPSKKKRKSKKRRSKKKSEKQIPSTPESRRSSHVSTPSIMRSGSGLGTPYSSPSWMTFWPLLMATLGVVTAAAGHPLPEDVAARLEDVLTHVNVLGETIGGSTTKIRKATSSLPESAVRERHRFAHDRIKILLNSFGIGMQVFRDVPLRVNMRPSQMFDLPVLRERVDAMAEYFPSEDMTGAHQLFLTLHEAAIQSHVETEGLPAVLF